MNQMEAEVMDLWWEAICDDKNADRVIGLGNTSSYFYDKPIVQSERYREKLSNMLESIDTDADDLRFYDLKNKKEGDSWTPYHQKLDFFVSMLHATGLLEYDEQPVYCTYPKSNPKVHVLKNTK